MTIEFFITTYGYAALLVGTLLEGEAAATVGGFLAHRGYLHLSWVLLILFFGSFATPQVLFHLARGGGGAILQRRPDWKVHVQRVHQLFDRRQTAVMLGFRLLYGLRTVAPMVIGMSSVSVARFTLLNAIGAVIWALVMGFAGYAFGQVLEAFVDDVKKYEMWVVGGIVAVAAAAWTVHWIRQRRRIQKQQPQPST